MSNMKTIIEEWSIRDLEDNSAISISVISCTELGNQCKPGIQVMYMGNIINCEPLTVERWAYQANKAGTKEYLLQEQSWTIHDDQFVKLYLLIGPTLKIKIEVKTRSSKISSKEYDLPFSLE